MIGILESHKCDRFLLFSFFPLLFQEMSFLRIYNSPFGVENNQMFRSYSLAHLLFFYNPVMKMIQYDEKSLASQFAMMSLMVTLTFISLFGNGSFIAIFARFKVFRNFPNILFANLALVNLLNTLINLPLFAVYGVPEPSLLKGRTWAILCTLLHMEFVFLTWLNMFAVVLDRFQVMYFDLKYYTWKTTKKAKIAVFLMWFVCTIAVALSCVPLFYMDFDGVPLVLSRKKIFQKEIWLLRQSWFQSQLLQLCLEY